MLTPLSKRSLCGDANINSPQPLLSELAPYFGAMIRVFMERLLLNHTLKRSSILRLPCWAALSQFMPLAVLSVLCFPAQSATVSAVLVLFDSDRCYHCCYRYYFADSRRGDSYAYIRSSHRRTRYWSDLFCHPHVPF
jgi:hypothetical protein